jgi:hypothetical protein
MDVGGFWLFKNKKEQKERTAIQKKRTAAVALKILDQFYKKINEKKKKETCSLIGDVDAFADRSLHFFSLFFTIQTEKGSCPVGVCIVRTFLFITQRMWKAKGNGVYFFPPFDSFEWTHSNGT